MYEFLHHRARDVMTREPVTIGPQTSLAEVHALFERHDFDALPVLGDAGRLVGLVSKLDLLKAFRFTEKDIVPHYEDIMQQAAETVMTREPACVPPSAPLTRVLETMVATRNKSLPVVDGDVLAGIVAREDVLRALRAAARTPRA